MSNKLLSITVRGKSKEWSFQTFADSKYLDEWRKDGLEIYEIENIIPEWVASLGLTKPWCFFQDILNFKNPFGDKTP